MIPSAIFLPKCYKKNKNNNNNIDRRVISIAKLCLSAFLKPRNFTEGRPRCKNQADSKKVVSRKKPNVSVSWTKHDAGNHTNSHRSYQSNDNAVSEADNLVNTARAVQAMPRTGSPALKQATFSCKVEDK